MLNSESDSPKLTSEMEKAFIAARCFNKIRKEENNAMDIYFRAANINDLPQIMDLIKSAISQMENSGIMQWDELYPTSEDFVQDINAGHLYVGLINGNIAVVYALNQLYDEAYKYGNWKIPEKPFIIIHRLCVHPKYQHLGIAQKTMSYIETQVTQLKIAAIRLDVYSQNPYALKLYKKCGYTTIGTANWRKGMFYLMEKYL